ncbi:MAG: restriction endonuclease, SacI family [Chloroflexi bacterium]|nr:restriction endonuclease, SacI family [Chloroflexota bacterium]
MYQTTLELLNDVYSNRLSAEDLLAETVRLLLVIREESRQRIEALLAGLRASEETVPLSSEMIVNLIQQHLSTPGASRLPVLVVAAAYRAAGEHLRERVLPLESHTSADEQTGALGDVQITLLDDNDVVTSYEMKNRRVTHEDIEIALRKIANSGLAIDNYIFITKEPIDQDVQDYAREVYARTGGIEVVVLDCMGFIRHFLHLFHRLRTQYLEAYQQLVLEEPLSAVNQHLKEVFLNLRQAAEAMLSES